MFLKLFTSLARSRYLSWFSLCSVSHRQQNKKRKNYKQTTKKKQKSKKQKKTKKQKQKQSKKQTTNNKTKTPEKYQIIVMLHSQERAAEGLGLHVSAHKTKCICFNKRGDNSTQNSSSLKLMNKFTNLGNSVSSTEIDINTRLAKAWTAIDRLSVIWKSDLTDKIKRSFSKQQSCRYCYMDALHGC